MSPRRRVKHAAVKQRRPLDIVYAVIAVLVVAGLTALTIWLIRPGGYASDQPRIATVLFGSLCVFGLVFWVSRGPDRPVVGRWTIWGALILLAVALVSVGYVLKEAAKWNDAVVIASIAAGGILVLGIVTECGLLIRKFGQGSLAIRILLSVAVALICGAIAALAWPGGIKLERPKAPTLPTPITAPVTTPAASLATTTPPPSSTP